MRATGALNVGTMSLLFWTIHRTHWQHFSFEWLSTQEVVPVQTVHSMLYGLSNLL